MWQVESTPEYIEWFQELDEEAKEAVLFVVVLLEQLGPLLKRPHADTLKGTKQKNLKELRTKTTLHVLRVAYYFDEDRQAILLIGGDKKGKNEKDFYKKLIAEAEKLLKRHKG